MNGILSRELLENLQKSCDIMTQSYREQTGNTRVEFIVLQLSDIACPKCRF